jgi:hypothetical protein
MTAWTFAPGRCFFPECQALISLPFALVTVGEAVGLEDLPVEDHVRDAVGQRAPQGFVQVRGLRGQHVHGLIDVPVGRRAGDRVVGGEAVDPGPVPEPAQRENCLVTTGELPAAGRRPAAAPLGGE